MRSSEEKRAGTESRSSCSRLFLGLRFLDMADLDIGVAEGVFPEIREGRAIMNRLRKAAEETLWSG